MKSRAATPDEAELHVRKGLPLAHGLPVAPFRGTLPAPPFPGLPFARTRPRPVTGARAESGAPDDTRAP